MLRDAPLAPGLRVALVAGGLFSAAALAAFLLAPLLIPILLAFVFYAVLEPVSSRLMALGMSASAASLSVLAMLAAAVMGILSWIAPQFSQQVLALQQRLPHLWELLDGLATRTSRQLEELTGLSVGGVELSEQAIQQGNEWGQAVAAQMPGFVTTTILVLVIAPLLTFFLVRDWKGLRNRLLDLLPNRQFELGWLIYGRVARQLQRYVRGVMMQSAIVALVATVGFWLVGVDTPLLFGVLTGLLNVIPYVGPPLAMIPPVISVLGDPTVEPWVALWAVAVVLTAQLVDNLLVLPSLIAHSVNLHPLVVIGGIIVSGHFFGLLGMILAVPTMAAAWIIVAGLHGGLRSPASGYQP